MTLRRRVLLATIVVATVAVVVTAIAAFGLVRSSANSVAREQLVAQVDRLASATPATRAAIIRGLSALDDADVLIASIGPTGTVSGSATGIVRARVVQQIRDGQSVSTLTREGTETYLVEARPVIGGGGVVVMQSSTRVVEVAASVLPRLLIALAIGLGVAIVVAVVLSGLLSRPLSRLASAARRLASGEREIAFEPSGLSEINDVEAALSALGAALAVSEGRQREFLLSISHELRTPLTAIRGYAEALSDGMVPEADVREVGRTLVAESTRLAAFTTDLLALARLESDDFPLENAQLDLTGVVRDAQKAWAAVATTAEVQLVVEAPDGEVTVVADAARMRQVVDGLLENALRVSPANTEIHMRTSSEPHGALLVITDGGPGLTPEDAAVAFERGRLHERYRSLRPVGTGLGLSIAARLVERMGAQITAHSVPGSGAEFRIRFTKGVAL